MSHKNIYNPIMSLFSLIQLVYWLSLSTWFGGVLFVAMAAPIIFRVVREQQPVLPLVLSVNLENQHADLLAGTIVWSVLAAVGRMELACAGGVLIGLIGQWALAGRGATSALIIRSILFLGATLMVIYDWRIVWPRIDRHRKEYLEHADEPELANAAKEQFDRYHRESVNVLSIVLLFLLGLILFSGGISSEVTVSFRK